MDLLQFDCALQSTRGPILPWLSASGTTRFMLLYGDEPRVLLTPPGGSAVIFRPMMFDELGFMGSKFKFVVLSPVEAGAAGEATTATFCVPEDGSESCLALVNRLRDFYSAQEQMRPASVTDSDQDTAALGDDSKPANGKATNGVQSLTAVIAESKDVPMEVEAVVALCRLLSVAASYKAIRGSMTRSTWKRWRLRELVNSVAIELAVQTGAPMHGLAGKTFLPDGTSSHTRTAPPPLTAHTSAIAVAAAIVAARETTAAFQGAEEGSMSLATTSPHGAPVAQAGTAREGHEQKEAENEGGNTVPFPATGRGRMGGPAHRAAGGGFPRPHSPPGSQVTHNRGRRGGGGGYGGASSVAGGRGGNGSVFSGGMGGVRRAHEAAFMGGAQPPLPVGLPPAGPYGGPSHWEGARRGYSPPPPGFRAGPGFTGPHSGGAGVGGDSDHHATQLSAQLHHQLALQQQMAAHMAAQLTHERMLAAQQQHGGFGGMGPHHMMTNQQQHQQAAGWASGGAAGGW